jgi:hypothetical protein
MNNYIANCIAGLALRSSRRELWQKTKSEHNNIAVKIFIHFSTGKIATAGILRISNKYHTK